MNKDITPISEAMYHLDKALTVLGAIPTTKNDKQIMAIADIIEELRAKQ